MNTGKQRAKKRTSVSGYMDDQPIKTKRQDKYKIFDLAETVASRIIATKNPKGTCVAISAKWGAGKSSVLNLIRKKIEEQKKKNNLSCLEFECWHHSNKHSMVTAFYGTLAKAIEEIEKCTPNNQKHKDLCSVAKRTLEALRKLQWQGTLNLGFAQIGASADKQSEPLEPDTRALHTNIETCLCEGKIRFIVIIDDVDRLSPDEILLVLKLLKSVGNLSNIFYLVALDNDVVERVIEARYPFDGKDYLEKFMTTQEKLETSDKELLISHFLGLLKSTKKPAKLKGFKLVYTKGDCPKAEDIITDYADTPRKICRFADYIIKSDFHKLYQEVNVADLLVLKALAFFEEKLYAKVAAKKAPLSKDDLTSGKENPYLALVKPANRSKALELLKYLFPSEREGKYSHSKVRRPISDSKYYPLYFGGELGRLPHIKDFFSFIKNASDQAKLKTKLLQLKDLSTEEDKKWKPSGRRDGKPQNSLDIFLAELARYYDLFDEEQATVFLCLLFHEPQLIIRQSRSGRALSRYKEIQDVFFSLIIKLYPDDENKDYQDGFTRDEVEQKKDSRKLKCSKMLLTVLDKADVVVQTNFVLSLCHYPVHMPLSNQKGYGECHEERIKLFRDDTLKMLRKSTYNRMWEEARNGQLIKDLVFLRHFLYHNASLAVHKWPVAFTSPSEEDKTEYNHERRKQGKWIKEQMKDDFTAYQFISLCFIYTSNDPKSIETSIREFYPSNAEDYGLNFADLKDRAKELASKNYGTKKQQNLIAEFLTAVEQQEKFDLKKKQSTSDPQNNQGEK